MDQTPSGGGRALRSFPFRRALPWMVLGACLLVVVRVTSVERAHLDPSEFAAWSPVLPAEARERVEAWMGHYSGDQRERFQASLAREARFAGLIRAKLRERGMPEELLYLAMVESGLSPRATSPAEAAGVWQFTEPTAVAFGLRVDEWVDERRDPVRATDAALEYFGVLHDRYGSWPLAAAAYNAGPGRVDRALRRFGVGEGPVGEDAYWVILEDLPPETREYVPRILAAAAVSRAAEAYGMRVASVPPYDYDRVWVPEGTWLGAVARALRVETAVLRELNPHLIQGVTPPGGPFGLRVPPRRAGEVIAALGGRPSSQMSD